MKTSEVTSSTLPLQECWWRERILKGVYHCFSFYSKTYQAFEDSFQRLISKTHSLHSSRMGSIAYFNTYTFIPFHSLILVLKYQQPGFPDILFLIPYSLPTFLYSTTNLLPPDKKKENQALSYLQPGKS